MSRTFFEPLPGKGLAIAARNGTWRFVAEGGVESRTRFSQSGGQTGRYRFWSFRRISLFRSVIIAGPDRMRGAGPAGI